MGYFKDREWDLTKERPKVLFFGNGFFHEECDWDSFIEENKRKQIDLRRWAKIEKSPYTIRASVALDTEDTLRREKYKTKINEIHEKSSINQELIKLLKIPFDAILTTNYTYQIERHIIPDFCQYSDYKKGKKYAKQTFIKREGVKKDAKYLLQTFNFVESNDISQKIWHIHGEARRTSSIVATHDEYGKLVEKIRSYIDNYGDRYHKFYKNFVFKSWIDYLIMGDVYIVGSQLDYTEFDLWWLFSRRIREKAQIGKYVYYEPEEEREEKKIVLDLLKIEWVNLNCYKYKNMNYPKFYRKVVEDLGDKIL